MDIDRAVEVLRDGGVIIFPTDTVWGVGVAADNPTAIRKFYKIKKREEGKPSQVLVGSLEQAKELGIFGGRVSELVKTHWPGALTIVVPSKDGHTVGLRVPGFPLVRELCRKLGGGIMAGSANFAGGRAPMRREELNPELVKLVDLVMEGECGGQPASTVVDTTVEPWRVVRQGSVKIQ